MARTPRSLLAGLLVAIAAGPAALAEEGAPAPGLPEQVKQLRQANEDLEHRLDELSKAVDDLAWQLRLSDVAVVEKWRIAGPPPANPRNPKAPGARNPVKFFTYSFVPKDRKKDEKLPLIVLPHGGVHGDFASPYSVHIVRELVAQGYVVVAPEYRGSTGYGKGFYEQIDYGGREVDDVRAARDWAVENLEGVDPGRVGLVGWSHGGLIVLLEAFAHPRDYRCVFAGVPVSDLVARMGYSDEEYRREFSAPYHLGKTVREDIDEYKRRSPVWQVEKLDLPLLIHTNTNDEDVNYLEVEHLVQALKAAGKKFEYKVYQDAPGGHSMDRLDTRLAREARRDVYRFLARYLEPPRPAR
ncbi:MAG TPA: alpha/beta fold hydrolase [Anaeromyxobacter sp.]|nr:alpha/beta fold hydrolase [Anaeromyxobacter sp.]